jgi:hypothetical protein
MSVRTPSTQAARARLCTFASMGFLACMSPMTHAASLDQHVSDDDGVVALTGVVDSSPISRHATQRLASSSKEEGKHPGFLPARMEMSRTRWNSGAAAGVGVDRLDYRVSYGTPSSAVSVGVGTVNYSVQQLPAGLEAGPMTTGTMPSVSVAYRQRFDEKVHLNMEATRASYGSSQQSQDTLTTTRVGVEYQPARNSIFGVERASLALNMGASGNFAMKIRHGGPMFYMKSKF